MNSSLLKSDSQLLIPKRDLARFPKRTLRHVLKKLQHLVRDLTKPDSDIVEATHQLRVISRKADVALRIFRAWIPNHRRRRLKKTLKRVRVDAGAVRDLDLQEMRWRPNAADFASQVSQEASAWLYARIQDQRSESFDRLMKWTHKSQTKQLRNQLQNLIDRLRSCGARRFERLVSQAIIKLIDVFREAAPATSNSLAECHQTRIRARRLRYGVEFLQDVIPDDTKQLVSSLGSIQEQLGKINDDATGNRFVRQSLAGCPDQKIAASLQSWLDHSESAATSRLVDVSIQMPSPTQSLEHFLRHAR